MDFERLPSFLLSLGLHLGLFALVLFWPASPAARLDLLDAPMVTGLVTIKPGQSLPGRSAEKPREAAAEKTGKAVEKAPSEEKAQQPARIEKNEAPETPREVKPVEKPAPEPEAVPIPKEPEKKEPVPKPEEQKKPEQKKPEARKDEGKKPEAKKPESKKPEKKNDLDGVLAALDKEVKAEDKRKRGSSGDALSGALNELAKQSGGPGEGGPGQGSGGGGDGVGALGSYIESVISRVKPNWSYVEPANRKNYTAVVNIRIDREGSIIEARIVQPSGNSYFDGTVMNAIRVTGSLEPPDSPEMMDLNIAFSPESLRGR